MAPRESLPTQSVSLSRGSRWGRFWHWFARDYGFIGPGWHQLLVLAALPFLLVIFIATLSLTVVWPFAVSLLWRFIDARNDSTWFLLSGVVVVAGCGLGMYFLRERAPRAYGIVEISGALVLAWMTLHSTHESGLVFALGIMASIYVIVRGIGNLVEGYRREQASSATFRSGSSR